VTSPLFVQTSIVVKSTDARTSQCAWRKLFQVDCRFRSGAGSTPWAFRMLLTVVSEISWPRLDQRALDAVVTPVQVFTGHPHYQFDNLIRNRRTPQLLAV
jgi:hypothetical protein